MMKRLFIYPNLRTPKHQEMAIGAVEQLEKIGLTCSMSPQHSERMFGSESYVRFAPEEAELIVAIGGDGSVLRAAQIAILHELPLLGINSGRLGFLCALEASACREITREDFDTLVPTRRSLLSFTLGEKEYFSVNDVIVAKEHFGESIELEASFSGQVQRFCGDGLVIATPTGSTAYNQSAGGAILEHDVDALAVTPICPHEKSICPRVIHPDRVIWVTLIRALSGKAAVYSDGVFCGHISDSIHIQRASRTLTLLTKK